MHLELVTLYALHWSERIFNQAYLPLQPHEFLSLGGCLIAEWIVLQKGSRRPPAKEPPPSASWRESFRGSDSSKTTIGKALFWSLVGILVLTRLFAPSSSTGEQISRETGSTPSVISIQDVNTIRSTIHSPLSEDSLQVKLDGLDDSSSSIAPDCVPKLSLRNDATVILNKQSLQSRLTGNVVIEDCTAFGWKGCELLESPARDPALIGKASVILSMACRIGNETHVFHASRPIQVLPAPEIQLIGVGSRYAYFILDIINMPVFLMGSAWGSSCPLNISRFSIASGKWEPWPNPSCELMNTSSIRKSISNAVIYLRGDSLLSPKFSALRTHGLKVEDITMDGILESFWQEAASLTSTLTIPIQQSPNFTCAWDSATVLPAFLAKIVCTFNVAVSANATDNTQPLFNIQIEGTSPAHHIRIMSNVMLSSTKVEVLVSFLGMTFDFEAMMAIRVMSERFFGIDFPRLPVLALFKAPLPLIPGHCSIMREESDDFWTADSRWVPHSEYCESGTFARIEADATELARVDAELLNASSPDPIT